MSIHRHRATWRSITFNAHYLDDGTLAPDDPGNVVAAAIPDHYALEECNVQRVSVQDYRELRQYLEGAEPNEAYEGVRAITGTGRIVAPDYATLEDRSWALNEAFSTAACRIAAQATTPKGVLPFDFKRDTLPLVGRVPTSKLLRFYARPGPGRPIWIARREGGLARPFSFQLIAFDPFAYDQASANTNLGNLAGGANNVSNPGNIYTKPTIVITFSGAGGAAVVLTNTTTGQSITLNLVAMANLQTLTIDVARSTIVRDNGTNQMDKVTAGFLSTLFLLAGNNNITWSAAGGVSQVQFQVRGAYA